MCAYTEYVTSIHTEYIRAYIQSAFVDLYTLSHQGYSTARCSPAIDT